MHPTADELRRTFETQLAQARANGSQLPTVASVASAARIARSTLYRFHPDIAAEIRALRGNHEARKHDQLRTKLRLLAAQLKIEKQLTSALARACAELAAERATQREEFEDERLSLELRIQHLEKKLQGKRPLNLVRS